MIYIIVPWHGSGRKLILVDLAVQGRIFGKEFGSAAIYIILPLEFFLVEELLACAQLVARWVEEQAPVPLRNCLFSVSYCVFPCF